MVPDHPRLAADLLAAVLHPGRSPVSCHLYQEAVGEGLPRETGARGTKGDRDAPGTAEPEELLDLLDRPAEQHRLRYQPVAAGVRGEGDAVDGPNQDPFRRDDPGELVDEFWRRSREGYRSVGHGA